jgi:hypothetical protein
MPHPSSDLPIMSPERPRASQVEKYGGLYYLGIAGLVLLISLLGWFGFGLWTQRAYFQEVYALHDATRSEEERINAALALSRSVQANQRILWENALDRRLPELARYVLAESLTAEAAQADPRGYALAVARSEGWPSWLRLLALRPVAYAAGQGTTFPAEAMQPLSEHSDAFIRLWAEYAMAVSTKGDRFARLALEQSAIGNGEPAALARFLLDALHDDEPRRTDRLDEATRWMRSHHAESARLWAGWTMEDDRIMKQRSHPHQSLPSPSSKRTG